MMESIAIIGDGVASLITLAVLRHAGVPADAIVLYGDSSHPLAYLKRYAQAVGQQQMRSESSGHLAAQDFPGLAWDDTKRHLRFRPLVASLLDRYNPPLSLVLEQADRLIEKLGFFDSKVVTRVGRVVRQEASTPGFALHDVQGNRIADARHVILALGHAGLAWPEAIVSSLPHSAISHAYEAPVFQSGQRVAILGSGMAAAHLWSLALDQGAQVLALHRRPLCRQQLNAPRQMFSTVGIEAYQGQDSASRLAFLRELGHGTFPWRLSWEYQWFHARRKGQLRMIQTELTGVKTLDSNSKIQLELGTDDKIEVDKLVCATGFVTTALAYPLIAHLIQTNHLPLYGQFMLVADNFTVASLSQPDSVLGVVGALARWALPVADTFAGIKYAARRLVTRLMV